MYLINNQPGPRALRPNLSGMVLPPPAPPAMDTSIRHLLNFKSLYVRGIHGGLPVEQVMRELGELCPLSQGRVRMPSGQNGQHWNYAYLNYESGEEGGNLIGGIGRP